MPNDELAAQDELAALVEQLPDEVLDYIDDLETRVEKAESALANYEPPAEDETDFEKALSEVNPELAAFVKSQSDRLAEAEAALAQERITKADAQWTQKVRSVDGLIDNPEEFGPKLRAVAEVDAELADSIVSALEAANNRVEKSALFSESGHSAPAPGSALERVEQIAKAMTEADPSKTKESAMVEAFEADPALYDQYLAERREAVREA